MHWLKPDGSHASLPAYFEDPTDARPGEGRIPVAHKYGAAFHVAKAHGHFLFSEPGWEAEAAHILDWVDALPRVIREAASSGHPFPDRENAVADSRVSTPANHRPAPEST